MTTTAREQARQVAGSSLLDVVLAERDRLRADVAQLRARLANAEDERAELLDALETAQTTAASAYARAEAAERELRRVRRTHGDREG
jgi:predicted  nucleic acid-binding Zn-ribbon protein